MKFKSYAVLLFACLVAASTSAQILRPFTARYSNASERGNIVFVSNNIITSLGENTSELPPGGLAANNGNTAAYIDADGDAATFMYYGSAWKYLDNNTRPANWNTVAYSDAAWASGNGELGYGDGDETTVVSYGPDAANKYITTYFRKTINVTNPTSYSGFIMNIKRDDGVVVYINGVEVHRSNMPGGAVAHGTLSSANIDGVQEFVSVTLANTVFVNGANTIAVEVHQSGPTSTDISFDMELKVSTTIVPYGSTWKYLSQATAPAATWATPGFVETWASGPGSFYYNNNVGVTDVGFGGDQNLRHPTVYFRKQVTITGLASYTSFTVNMKRDDGAAVYVNGTLVYSNNLPATWTHTTLATTDAIENATETISFVIPASSFVEGSNMIAVEVHNGNTGRNPQTATDLLFDLEMVGNYPNATFSSSAASINLSSCSHVLWAGLYWGASQGTNGTNTAWITGENNVKIKVPGAANYQTVTSVQTDYHNGTLAPGLPHTGYRAFAEITSLLNTSNPNGLYYIADVVGPNGIINGAGGWTIVIVYSNPAEAPRNLNVFDGSVIINGGDPSFNIPITGFVTPPTGPVSCELGAVVYDGDRASLDSFSFKQNSNPAIGAYTNLTPNATSNLNDMWNSTISYKGALVTSRFPAHSNTLGYDADIIEVPNVGNAVLGNGQTSASIRIGSPSENYFLHVVTTSISTYTPSFSMDKGSTDLNGGGLVAGDIIRYRINYSNVGNDASLNSVITDNIPTATGFVPGSIRINGVAKTDASADDEAEYDFINRRVTFRLGTGANTSSGGTVAISGSGYVEFDVYTTVSCEILACGTPTNNIARIDYIGQTSAQNLYDSSGYLVAGCLTTGPISNVITGGCFIPKDTIIVNNCPSTTVTLPYALLAGYSFFNNMPFNASTAYNPTTAITQSGTYYAYFNSGGSCHDTVRIRVYITPCPDIDDDNDGIPDYVEMNNPLALQDANTNGVPNYCDPTYPGYVDYNSDGINDFFDPSADADNDATPNFLDANFPGYVDSNGDLVNDNFDWDLDGIPNQLDRDTDNDGIPDVAENFGVDANGDGIIDNYSDTDNDGLSQNVDGNNTGALSSGTGLGTLDSDGDGVPNYFDLDSDNDGLPDNLEAYGVDANNDGLADNYTDADGDGFNDNVDGDVGNDGTAENSAAALLRTGTDGNNDGRADSFPNNNMDGDSKPNPYDLDSDGDGIPDVKEAMLTDADNNSIMDGTLNAKGWNTTVASMGSMGLPNTDASGRPNVYDIDSDNDGIPDNVEGRATLAYALPSGLDSDGDGIDNSYDNTVGFGGNGTIPYDRDGDTTPDYLDSDTDNDGQDDIIEGNDFNFNGASDDLVTLTGIDTDGDGLDDRFDNNNSSAEGTSAYMGLMGSTSGDPTPGSITTVQHTPAAEGLGCLQERDWRCIWYVLHCDFISFKASLQNQKVSLDWKVICKQEVNRFVIERSTNRSTFEDIISVPGQNSTNETEVYNSIDDVSGVSSDLIYYRLRTEAVSGRVALSSVIAIRRNINSTTDVQIMPNPVRGAVQVMVNMERSGIADIQLVDGNGRNLYSFREKLVKGSNTLTYSQTANLPAGVYYLRINMAEMSITRKINIIK